MDLDLYRLTAKRKYIVKPTLASIPSTNQNHLQHKKSLVQKDDIVVSGPPRRNHWVPDHLAVNCSGTDCNIPFTLTRRRHHCRRCGRIFCSACCSYQARLDQTADFNERGTLSRVCKGCYTEYCNNHNPRILNKSPRLVRSQSDRTLIESSPQTHTIGHPSHVETQITNHGIDKHGTNQANTFGNRNGGSETRSIAVKQDTVRSTSLPIELDMVVGSVPQNWSWSTF